MDRIFVWTTTLGVSLVGGAISNPVFAIGRATPRVGRPLWKASNTPNFWLAQQIFQEPLAMRHLKGPHWTEGESVLSGDGANELEIPELLSMAVRNTGSTMEEYAESLFEGEALEKGVDPERLEELAQVVSERGFREAIEEILLETRKRFKELPFEEDGLEKDNFLRQVFLASVVLDDPELYDRYLRIQEYLEKEPEDGGIAMLGDKAFKEYLEVADL